MLRVLALKTEEDEDDVLPPALLVLATVGRLLRLLEITLRVTGFEGESFLDTVLLLLPALAPEELEERLWDARPKRDALLETVFAEIKALLIFLILLRKVSSSAIE